jgi:polysaccharide export outer membrane protein
MEPAAQVQPPLSSAQAPGPDVYGGYMIGVGDILDIRVTDEESITGRYQVDPIGQIRVPLLSQPVETAGLTTFELSARLRDELQRQDILLEPSVTVFVARSMSQNVTILGAVVRPGIYALEQPTTLLDLISRAGGLQPNAGRQLTVTHRPANFSGVVSTQESAEEETTRSVDLLALVSGRDPSQNLLVKTGDVVRVPTAPVVFVVGAVTRPGAFTMQNSKAGMTILQAIAMAEGVLPTASKGNAFIVRQSSSDTEREEISIDLNDVIRGKQADQILLADDILFIPESGFKVGMRRVADVAVLAAGRAVAFGFFAGF